MGITQRSDRHANLRAPPQERRGTSLVPIQPGGSRLPLFCFHAGRGTISFYPELARELGPDQPVYALQAQGVEGGAPPHADIEEMVEHYTTEIRTIEPRGPYCLVGFCFGGLLAVEVARRLASEGSEIALVASFDGGSQRFDYAVETGPPQETSGSAVRQARRWVRRHSGALRRLSSRERWPYLWAKASTRLQIWLGPVRAAVNLVGGAVCRAIGRPLPRFLRGSYFGWMSERASRRWSPPPYPGDLVVFTSRGLFRDGALGWDGCVAGRLDVREVDVAKTRGMVALDEYHASFIHSVADAFRDTLRGAQSASRAEAACRGRSVEPEPLDRPPARRRQRRLSRGERRPNP